MGNEFHCNVEIRENRKYYKVYDKAPKSNDTSPEMVDIPYPDHLYVHTLELKLRTKTAKKMNN